MTPGNRRLSRPPEPRVEPNDPVAPPRPGRLGHEIYTFARTAAGVALVVGTSLGVAWVARRHVVTSPRFAIAAVDVVGNDHCSADTLATESGLTLGTNVFSADLDAARARLLADPWIAEATLARRLPGTISMRVVERKAAALVAMGDTYLATADGEPFKKVDLGDSPNPVASLPLVTGFRPENLTDDREGTTRAIRRAIDLAAEYERSGVARRAPLQEVHVEADGAFALVVGHSAIRLSLGAPPFRRKLDQATRIFAELDKRGARADAVMLDNDTRPERVVVRLK